MATRVHLLFEKAEKYYADYKKMHPIWRWPIGAFALVVCITAHHCYEKLLDRLQWGEIWGWVVVILRYAILLIVGAILFIFERNRCQKTNSKISYEPWIFSIMLICFLYFGAFKARLPNPTNVPIGLPAPPLVSEYHNESIDEITKEVASMETHSIALKGGDLFVHSNYAGAIICFEACRYRETPDNKIWRFHSPEFIAALAMTDDKKKADLVIAEMKQDLEMGFISKDNYGFYINSIAYVRPHGIPGYYQKQLDDFEKTLRDRKDAGI